VGSIESFADQIDKAIAVGRMDLKKQVSPGEFR